MYDKYKSVVNMERCKRCGKELFDFYYINYQHSHVDLKKTYLLCPECHNDLKTFLDEKKKNNNPSSRAHMSFVLPDDYKIME